MVQKNFGVSSIGGYRPNAGEHSSGEAIDFMRETAELPERFYEIYVVDGVNHWQGAVSLDRLVYASLALGIGIVASIVSVGGALGPLKRLDITS